MPEFIEPEVQKMRGSDSHNTISLLVGYTAGNDEFTNVLSGVETRDIEAIGNTTYRVTLPEKEVDSVCTIEGVVSVELDNDDVYTLDSEDFQSQTGSIM
ncbi:hypothetical protein [Halolamina sp.]|jgi:hypothetical protein|uniref:hypothetical protein n=1 Tax=Halolamina sp. TaxID=1940283 RepID=UPI000223BB53|nr:hypothetical protein Halar_2994 [halophilic archaeon DL31]